MNNPDDRWVKNNMVFIHYGKGYCITDTGAQICIGPVDDKGNPMKVKTGATENCQNPPENAGNGENSVSKLPDDINHANDNIHIQNDGGVLKHDKHPGGRPRKKEGYSRVTDWRRRKEKQGVLL